MLAVAPIMPAAMHRMMRPDNDGRAGRRVTGIGPPPCTERLHGMTDRDRSAPRTKDTSMALIRHDVFCRANDICANCSPAELSPALWGVPLNVAGGGSITGSSAGYVFVEPSDRPK